MPIQSNAPALNPAPREAWSAMRRGWAQTCPACGSAKLFGSYLKNVHDCPSCGEALHHHRADDAPPYFTMFIVGHVVIGGLLMVERRYAPDVWVHLVIWLPLTVVLSLWLLPRIKGALIGLQWALRMHGFDATGPDPAAPGTHPALKND
jgi:uncharacterized protein (DUF983 family)